MLPSIATVCTIQSIHNLVSKIISRGTFCTGGRVSSLPAPGLHVEGIGPIAIPVLSTQIQALRAVASQAPYGRGSETLVDTTIRNCLQIDPSLVMMTNPRWASGLRQLAGTAADELGVDPDHVNVELYKLLIYEAGGHFRAHKDIEKVDGMFATLVIQFPSSFSGGALVFRHGTVERIMDLGSIDGSSRHDFFYAAHYADCEHEIKEITSGHRMAAVYSLCWKGNGPPPGSISPQTAVDLADAVRSVDRCCGIMLEHQYTAASLARYGVRALKGKDRAIADTLMAASALMQQEQDGYRLELYIVRAKREVQDIEGGGEELPVLDLKEGSVFGMDGSEGDPSTTGPLKRFRFYKDVINTASEEDHDHWWKDSEGGSVKTWGNEGDGGIQFYSCYVLTFWPSKFHFKLLCRSDIVKAIDVVINTRKVNAAQAAAMLEEVKEFIDESWTSNNKKNLVPVIRGLLEMNAKELFTTVLCSLTKLPRTTGRKRLHYERYDEEGQWMGLPNRQVVNITARAVLQFGWENTKDTLSQVLQVNVKNQMANRLELLTKVFHISTDNTIHLLIVMQFLHQFESDDPTLDERSSYYGFQLLFALNKLDEVIKSAGLKKKESGSPIGQALQRLKWGPLFPEKKVSSQVLNISKEIRLAYDGWKARRLIVGECNMSIRSASTSLEDYPDSEIPQSRDSGEEHSEDSFESSGQEDSVESSGEASATSF